MEIDDQLLISALDAGAVPATSTTDVLAVSSSDIAIATEKSIFDGGDTGSTGP